jgi:hypothetical protein
MAITVSAPKSVFVPAPPGVHQAVCVDVVDLGVLKVTYQSVTQMKHKVRLVWQIDETMENGERYVVSRRYTASLHPKASLRKDLEAWRSKAFTEEEATGFDLEVLLGVNCLLNVVQTTRGGDTYSNVVGIMPLRKGMTKMEPKNFIRRKDREEPIDATSAEDTTDAITDDDIPF